MFSVLSGYVFMWYYFCLFHMQWCSLVKSNLLSLWFYLTNRFHVALRLFTNRLQMTSKAGKNKKVAHADARRHGILIFMKITTFFNLKDMFRCYEHHRQLPNIWNTVRTT